MLGSATRLTRAAVWHVLELGGLTGLQKLSLGDNELTGTIPDAIALLGANHILETFEAHGTSLSGMVPDELCSIEVSFDCNEQLGGCNCTCGVGSVALMERGHGRRL